MEDRPVVRVSSCAPLLWKWDTAIVETPPYGTRDGRLLSLYIPAVHSCSSVLQGAPVCTGVHHAPGCTRAPVHRCAPVHLECTMHQECAADNLICAQWLLSAADVWPRESNTPNISIPYHTIPYHTVPYHTIPYHTIPYRTILYHTIPYRTILYLTILYRTIPGVPTLEDATTFSASQEIGCRFGWWDIKVILVKN